MTALQLTNLKVIINTLSLQRITAERNIGHGDIVGDHDLNEDLELLLMQIENTIESAQQVMDRYNGGAAKAS